MFIISALATFRLTYMIQDEAGPWDSIYRLRLVINKSQFGESLLACFWCLSIWVSAPFAIYLANNFWEFIVYLLALSSVASFVHLAKKKFLD